MSAAPFFASRIPRLEPPVCTSTRTLGCACSKRLAISCAMGAIVLEPVKVKCPESLSPFSGRLELPENSLTPQPLAVKKKPSASNQNRMVEERDTQDRPMKGGIVDAALPTGFELLLNLSISKILIFFVSKLDCNNTPRTSLAFGSCLNCSKSNLVVRNSGIQCGFTR